MVVAEESQLVRQAQAGDRAAFTALYDAYLPKIYDFTLGMLRNRADAEDVTSETFLRAVERLGSLKDPQAFRGWLYTIARNGALSLVESRKRAVPTADHDEQATAHVAAVMPDPETAADDAELRDLVWDAAATLNPRDHQVFELTVRHGLSSSEIAPILGVRPAYAYILTNRLKGSVAEALEAVLLCRTGRAACGELDALIERYGDDATPRLRKAVTRHAKDCETCSSTKATRASVPALLAGMAFAAPSAAFAAELASKIDTAWPPTPSGPTTGSDGDGASRLRHLAGAAAMVVVITGGLVSLAAAPVDDAERVDVFPALEETEADPEPTPDPSPTAPPSTRAPVADRPLPTLPPRGTPTVVIIDEGGDGGTIDTGDEDDGNDTRPTRPPNPDPDPDDTPARTPQIQPQ